MRTKRFDSNDTVHHVSGAYEVNYGNGTTSTAPVVTKHYRALGQLLAVRNGGVLSWAGTDHLGSTVRTTDSGFTGQVAASGYLGTLLADSPQAVWRLDEAEGVLSAEDTTGTRHTGSSGGRTTTPTGPLASTVATSFDGSSGAVSLSEQSNDLALTGAVTVEAWVQLTSASTHRVIFAKGRGQNGDWNGYELDVTCLPTRDTAARRCGSLGGGR